MWRDLIEMMMDLPDHNEMWWHLCNIKLSPMTVTSPEVQGSSVNRD